MAQRLRTHSISWLFAYVAALTTLVHGCLLLPASDHGDMPALVRYAIEHVETPQSDADDPLLAHPFDTAVDPLSDLDGCWASVQSHAIANFMFVDVMEFDAAAGTFARTSYGSQLRNWRDFPPIYTVERGTFEISTETLITLHEFSIAANMDQSGKPVSEPVIVTPADYHLIRPALVTLSGDRARISLGIDSENDPNAPLNSIIFHRIPCQE